MMDRAPDHTVKLAALRRFIAAFPNALIAYSGGVDKPAMACTASRIPHGDPVSAELLARIEMAEDLLVALGFDEMRVRCHQDVARIEVPPERFTEVLSQRETLIPRLRALGFRHVTLDLAGFRSGSLIVLNVVKGVAPCSMIPSKVRSR